MQDCQDTNEFMFSAEKTYFTFKDFSAGRVFSSMLFKPMLITAFSCLMALINNSTHACYIYLAAHYKSTVRAFNNSESVIEQYLYFYIVILDNKTN